MYDLNLDRLTGKKILKIWWSDDYLEFETDLGSIAYTVEGDCCSGSYFHDFIGVEKLLRGGRVKMFEAIPLEDKRHEDKNQEYGDLTQFYGYRITIEDETFGEVSAVLAFRNESNGYYGGWMEDIEARTDHEGLTNLVTDHLGD